MGKEKKRQRSGSASSSSSSSSDEDTRRLKKLKKKLKKEQRRSEKLLKKKMKAEKKKAKELKVKSPIVSEDSGFINTEPAADIPVALMERSKAMAPMTKEEWDKRQSVVRRVFDEESGRYRLIKGDGEVIEEIVSRNRHKQINQQATQADGTFFQTQTVEKKP